MSSDTPAGTPEPAKEVSQSAGTPEATPEDSVTVSAQFKKEALESWKPAAERANALERQLGEERARREQLERLAYGGGAGQATDPNVELVQQLQEQAQYDPVAKAALMSMKSAAKAEAELWLTKVLHNAPESKRDKAADLIRLSGYQMSPEQALSMVTDPDAEATAKQLAELKQENERLKGVRANGASPATTTPSIPSSAPVETLKRSEYLAILKEGGERAKTLMQAVGNNKTKLLAD
jgi:hypothetical protein